jgi:hypothetical protein
MAHFLYVFMTYVYLSCLHDLVFITVSIHVIIKSAFHMHVF